jgi:predicted DNA-binding transcriptional regulator YafY
MGFMPDVEVVEPMSLRKKVREMLEKGALRHG